METRLKQEVRLLRMIRSLDPKASILVPAEDSDFRILRRWLEDGILKAKLGAHEGKMVLKKPLLTESGLALLKEKNDAMAEESSWAFLKKHRHAIYKWFFGLVAGILLAYFLSTYLKR